MSKIRVHELARELGRQNKEVIECLKSGGVDVKSHMSNVDEAQAAMVKQKFRNMGKEQMTKLDTPKTEEKVTAVNAEAETPKKKKNIIRVFHAQNASDGGKNRKKPAGDKPPVRPQGNYEKRPQGAKVQEAARLQEFRETMVRRAEQEHRETIVQEKEGREETTPVSRIRTALREAEREETAVRQEMERAQDVV